MFMNASKWDKSLKRTSPFYACIHWVFDCDGAIHVCIEASMHCVRTEWKVLIYSFCISYNTHDTAVNYKKTYTIHLYIAIVPHNVDIDFKLFRILFAIRCQHMIPAYIRRTSKLHLYQLLRASNGCHAHLLNIFRMLRFVEENWIYSFHSQLLRTVQAKFGHLMCEWKGKCFNHKNMCLINRNEFVIIIQLHFNAS